MFRIYLYYQIRRSLLMKMQILMNHYYYVIIYVTCAMKGTCQLLLKFIIITKQAIMSAYVCLSKCIDCDLTKQ